MKQTAAEWWEKLLIEQSKQIEISKAIAELIKSESKAIPELSDEEIERVRNIKYSHYNKEQVEAFIDGAKWYREQLKQIQ